MADTPTGPPGGAPPGDGGNRVSAGGYQGPSNFGQKGGFYTSNTPPGGSKPEAPLAKASSADTSSIDGLRGSQKDLTDGLENYDAMLEEYSKEIIKLVKEMEKDTSQEKKQQYLDALKKYEKASRELADSIGSNVSNYLKSYADAVEKSTDAVFKKFQQDPAKNTTAAIEDLGKTLSLLKSSGNNLVQKMVNNLLTNQDVVSITKLIEQNGKVTGASADEVRKNLAAVFSALKNAQKISDPIKRTDEIKKVFLSIEGSVEKAQKSLIENARQTEKAVTQNQQRIEYLLRTGKSGSLEAKLRMQGVTQTVRDSSTLEKLTGGANKGFGGKFVKEGGGFDNVAIQAQLIKNIGEAGALAAKTYRATGSEFGAMDRGVGGHLSAASAYKNQKSDMAIIGAQTGRTAEEAGQTFANVAGTMRVGTRDPGKRKQELDELTLTTLKLANATGLADTEVLELSKAYRDNLGKSAKESADAGYSVAKALSTINKDLKEDLQISGKQIHAIFSSLASDSSSFGKDIKEMNFWAEKSANQFAKMGQNATKMKQDIIDIAKLQTGGLTTGAGITGEIALSGGMQNLTMDRTKAAKLAGGEKNLQEYSKMGDTEFALKIADQMEKQGKKEEAQAIRDQDVATKGSSSAFLKASMTQDTATWLGTRSNKEAQEGAASIRGNTKLAGTLGLKNMDEIYNKMDDDARAAGNGTVMGAATGETGPERRLRELRGMMSKASTPEEKKKIEEQMKGVKDQVDKSSGGAATADALLDPMKFLTTALNILSGNVFANTIALAANTAAMFWKGKGGGGLSIPSPGSGTALKGLEAAEAASDAAKAVKTAKAAKSALRAEEILANGGKAVGRTTTTVSKSVKPTGDAVRAARAGKEARLATKTTTAAETAIEATKATETAVEAQKAFEVAKAGESSLGWFGKGKSLIGKIPGVSTLTGWGTKAGEVGASMWSKIPGMGKISKAGSALAGAGETVASGGKIARLLKGGLNLGRTAAAETGLLEVAMGGFSMASEGAGALSHKSGYYLGKQNEEMGENWDKLKKEKGFWNTTGNALGVLGSGVGYIGTATKELALPLAKGADWSLNKLLGHGDEGDSAQVQDQATDMIIALRKKSGKYGKYDFSKMSPEEREKQAKALEEKRKGFGERTSSIFGWGGTSKAELQSSMDEISKKSSPSSILSEPAKPLNTKEGSPVTLADLSKEASTSGGPKSLEADMGFNPGTNEIVFKVTDASKVMLKSLNQEFRNTAHA